MNTNSDQLSRFLEAQQGVYSQALAEVKSGKKTRHWMWFIFPQLKGLGHSETAQFYGISNHEEAVQYLNHPVLGARLVEICKELRNLQTANAVRVFGPVDALKLKSSMTLFSLSEHTHPVFQQVLDRFFEGEKDESTILLLSYNK
jgi:uncharacterized protein (DUF1810 family)